MAEPTVSKPDPDKSPRPETASIAKWVLFISGAILILLSVTVLVSGILNGEDAFEQSSRMLFNALLPLLGTWVGTVLAFYFSKQNFESANKSMERLVNLTSEQKLAQMFVEKEMLRPEKIMMFVLPDATKPEDAKLSDLRGYFRPGVTRLPIVDKDRVVKYIVHQSGLYKFVADKALGGADKATIDALTLKNLIEDAELQNWVANIVYVDEKASVADAKAKMEAKAGCQDLIVTKTASKDEPMLGWMTNVQIGALSKA